MVDTPRAVSYLTGTSFVDGQSAGSIVPNRLRDLAVTLQKRTGTVYRPTDPEFGAVGDGNSHPASTRFGSLSALQAFYGTTLGGVAVALTNELDWLGVQAAMQAAATLNGGVVNLGPAKYYLSNANSVTDGSGTLLITASGYNGGEGTSIQGVYGGTLLHWVYDLGAGRFGIRCYPRQTGGASISVGWLQDFAMLGPGVGGTRGQSDCQMEGIGSADRRCGYRLMVSGFLHGLNITGGQSSWEDIILQGCYHGLYWDSPDPSQFGNFSFKRLKCQNNMMGAMGVHHAASAASSNFIDCFFGVSPWGILKETNNGSLAQNIAVTACVFICCQFEGVGNGVIGDDRPNPASRQMVLHNTRFIMCQFMWDSYGGFDVHIPSTTRYAMFDVWQLFDVQFLGFTNPEQLIPPTGGSIWSAVGGGVVYMLIEGDIDLIIQSCQTAGYGMFNPVVFNVELVAKTWRGRLVADTGGFAIGDVVVLGSSGEGGGWKKAYGTGFDLPFGVVVYTQGTNNPVVLQTSGNVNANCNGTAISVGWVRTASRGAIVTASGQYDTTSTVIGYASGAGGGPGALAGFSMSVMPGSK